ncbi:MAG: type II secretion system F family protein [Bowdeniella nasicola]|nr:type II secretion system F family protein [Bowdeniella nasicola]
MNTTALAMLTALCAGVGIWQLASSMRAAKPTLVTRLAAYHDPAVRERLHHGSTLRHLTKILASDLGVITAMFGSTPASVRGRLAGLGISMRLVQFRIEQLIWAALSLAVILASVLILTLKAHLPAAVAIVLVVISPLAGALARDSYLTIQVRRYHQRLVQQLPDVCELLALALAAGEGATQALTRVAGISDAELPQRLRAMLAQVHAGEPLITAMHTFGTDVAIPPITRFTSAVITALERGTPLAGVLQALAADLRAQAREALLEEGGKREIRMLVPVVFIIMPLSVIFALYPGLHTLSLVVP